MLGNDWKAGNTLEDNLIQYQKHRNPLKTKVIIPVNIGTKQGQGSHWVLVCLQYNGATPEPFNIIYFDPKGRDSHPDISNALFRVFPKMPKGSLLSLPIPLQTEEDSVNCGPYIVVAAKSLIPIDPKQQPGLPDESLDIYLERQQQQEILRNIEIRNPIKNSKQEISPPKTRPISITDNHFAHFNNPKREREKEPVLVTPFKKEQEQQKYMSYQPGGKSNQDQ